LLKDAVKIVSECAAIMGKDETGVDRLGTHVVKMLMEPHFAASPLTIFTTQDLSAGTLQYV